MALSGSAPRTPSVHIRSGLDARIGVAYHGRMSSGPFFVYVTTNYTKTVLYTGQTHDLLRRVWEHREGLADGFTKRYRADKLVYYEAADDREGALYREKQIKGYSRSRKIEMIESMNPDWRDLYDELTQE